MMMIQEPIYKDLVLVGGGHAHVITLKKLAMRPIRHLRVTLISDQVYAPYSGMLPGHLAGWYDFEQCHFDLEKLCATIGVNFIHASAQGVHVANQSVLLTGRPPIHYDVLSINVGSRPDIGDQKPKENLLPLKPISEFLNKWRDFDSKLNENTPLKIAMVGGGTGGIEVSLVIQQKLKEKMPSAELSLFERDSKLLPGHNRETQKFFHSFLEKQNIKVVLNRPAHEFDGEWLRFSSGEKEKFDFVFWATQAKAHEWFKSCGLSTCDQGFLLTDEYLRIRGFKNIFAAGDCINFNGQSLPKSGVYAVREGKILAANLRKAVLGKTDLKKYRPQTQALALITTGEKYAVASRGFLFLRGKWLWRLKDKIDRRFMRKFKEMPSMLGEDKKSDTIASDPQEVLNTCGGCGAKLPAEVLEKGLACLSVQGPPDLVVGLDKPDDAVVVRPPSRKNLVTSVDSFRAFTKDLFLFGQVSVLHALNDIYAMGATPQYVQSIVTLPSLPVRKQHQDFSQLMAGLSSSIEKENCILTGGHSVEGSEVSLGFSVQGWVDEESLWRKFGAQVGDALILTKAVGTGALLAAHMKGQAEGRWIENLFKNLLLSQRRAFEILKKFSVHACTDVTGFGLGGHLLEMCQPDSLRVNLFLNQVPVFEGFHEVTEQGIEASIALANSRKIIPAIETGDSVAVSLPAISANWSVLFDPQTNGGLLAALPFEEAHQAIQSLKSEGYPHATIIGQVVAKQNPSGPRFCITEN